MNRKIRWWKLQSRTVKEEFIESVLRALDDKDANEITSEREYQVVAQKIREVGEQLWLIFWQEGGKRYLVVE